MKISTKYLDQMIESGEYDDFVKLSAHICGIDQFDQTTKNYGLPQELFVFVELLCWFAQGIRSGIWTYYEATPEHIQRSMEKAIAKYCPKEYVEMYIEGSKVWEDENSIEVIDKWIFKNEQSSNDWISSHIQKYKTKIREILV